MGHLFKKKNLNTLIPSPFAHIYTIYMYFRKNPTSREIITEPLSSALILYLNTGYSIADLQWSEDFERSEESIDFTMGFLYYNI